MPKPRINFIRRSHVAASCGLAAVLAAGCLLPSAAALAATADTDLTGGIEVTGATAGTYYAYKLFDGSFRLDEDGTLQMGDAVFNAKYVYYVLYALEQMPDEDGERGTFAVLTSTGEGYIDYVTTDGANSGELTDRALANAILDQIYAISLMDVDEEDSSEEYSNSAYTDATGSYMRAFANSLAYYLEQAGVEAEVTEEQGGGADTTGTVEFSDLDLGYWLVAQDSNDTEAMTTAMLYAVDGYSDDAQTVEGNESRSTKTVTPTVTKEVEDSEEDYDASEVTSLTGDGAIVDLLWDNNGLDGYSDGTWLDSADWDVTSSTYTNAYAIAAADDSTVVLEQSSVDYILTGTVSGNIEDFDTYYYAFHDTLPSVYCLTSDTTQDATFVSSRVQAGDDWTVLIQVDGGEWVDATDYFDAYVDYDAETGLSTVTWLPASKTYIDLGTDSSGDVYEASRPWATTYEGDLLYVLECLGYSKEDNDLSTTKVVVQYNIPYTSDELKAYLSSETTLTIGKDKEDDVYVEYSNNPYYNNISVELAGTTDDTPEDESYVYTYTLEVVKVDEDGSALDGAVFELTRKDADGEYVVAGYEIVQDGVNLSGQTDEDGVEVAYEDGVFVFTGLEADVEYTLTEVVVPSGYKSVDPITFTITATYDETTGAVTAISVASEDAVVDDATLNYIDPSTGVTFQTSDATAILTVVNIEGYDLPLTGQQGVALGIGVGALLIVGSLVLFFRLRRDDEDDEDQDLRTQG